MAPASKEDVTTQEMGPYGTSHGGGYSSLSWHGDLTYLQQRPPPELSCLGVGGGPGENSSRPSWCRSLTNAFGVAFGDRGTPVELWPAQHLIGLAVLLLKPGGDRAEVLQEGPSVHLIRASEVEQDFLP